MRLIKRLATFALFSLIIQASVRQIRSQEKFSILSFDARSLPAEISYKGKIVKGARWMDSNGENILILTQTGRVPTKEKKCLDGESHCYDAELYAYNYVRKNGAVSLLWKIADFERDCAFDLYAGFLKDALFITDLDSNGVAESSFLYKLACRSDVSPATLKLIMHEGATKYAIRGTTKIPQQENDGGGQMNIDPALKQAKPALRIFAVEKWNKYVIDRFESF